MKNKSKLILLTGLIFLVNLCNAQIPVNNNRYLAYVEVYPVKTGTPNRIQVAKNLGCNAINFTIEYRAVHGFNPVPNIWASYDSIMVKAKSLNMKIGIRVLVDNACLSSTLGDGSNNNAQICSNIVSSERMLGKLLNNGGELVHQQVSGESQTNPPEYENRVMTSLAAQSTKDRITSFTNEILTRYKSTYLTDILWMNIAYTSEQEGGFPYYSNKGNGGDVLFDYSLPMIQGFRSWLQDKYGTIEVLNSKWSRNYTGFNDTSIYPKIPQSTFKSAFEGNDGKDWWSYRTKVLRDATEIFMQTVRNQTTQIRVISDYGSVYDGLSLRRGTYNFKDINTNTDGVKINDAPYYDHRFATDLVRSNMPNKFIANEVEYSIGQNDNCFQQFRECYDNGANWVNIFQFQKLVDNNKGGDLTTIANTYLGTQVPTINATQSTSFKLSSMLLSEGCEFSNKLGNEPYVESHNCLAYSNWKTKFNISNSSVNIILEDDISEVFASGNCNVSAPINMSANPSTTTSTSEQKVTLSGNCPNGVIIWNTPSRTSSVKPTSTTTYTATCVISGASSVGSNNITVAQ